MHGTNTMLRHIHKGEQAKNTQNNRDTLVYDVFTARCYYLAV